MQIFYWLVINCLKFYWLLICWTPDPDPQEFYNFFTYNFSIRDFKYQFFFSNVLLGAIDISSISGYGLGSFKGMSPAFSWVYTDPNCLLKMSALSLLPVFKIPFSLRQDTPDKSLLKFFRKDQNRFGRSFRLQTSILVSVSEGMKILMFWLIDWLIDWLSDWLIDWLIDWLECS